jgi:FAD-dependent urate hydroxylase
MDVIIVGAGVGGLALANGLRKDGHGVRVLERAAALRTDGAAVTIFSNGAAAADGLGAPLTALGGTIDRLDFRNQDGRTFARADLRLLRRKTGFGVATIPRSAILHRFVETLPAGIIQYQCEINEHQVSGLQSEADVVVGADGYRSVVRRATLGDGDAAENGWVSWQGLTKTLPDLAAGTHAQCVVGTRGLCGLMPAGDGLVQWWFDVPAPAPEAPIVEWLRERFKGYADPVGELLDGLAEPDVQAYPHVLHRVPDQWGTGATTLLGDAAHAFPPSQAQGANQALEDAWLLRRALGQHGDVQTALRGYERERARHVRRIARLAASEVTNKPPSRAASLVGRLMSPAMLARLQLATIRRSSSVL